MGVSEEVAKESVVRSIYETDQPTEEMRNAPISEYIRASTSREKVVPIALLLSTGRFSYLEAREALAKDPIVRNIIGEFAVGKA